MTTLNQHADEKLVDKYVGRICEHVADGGWVSTTWPAETYLDLQPEHYALVPRIRGAIPSWVWRDSDLNYCHQVDRVGEQRKAPDEPSMRTWI